MSGKSISNSDVIALAACHVCAAMRKEPCRFNRQEDPEGLRTLRWLSHDDRMIRIKKIFAEAFENS